MEHVLDHFDLNNQIGKYISPFEVNQDIGKKYKKVLIYKWNKIVWNKITQKMRIYL